MTSTPVFEAFAVGLKPATLKAQRALARSIARAAIPSGATVEFLQRDRSTRSAPRDVAITPRANVKVSTGAAWERARAIQNTKGVRYAEPLFRGPGMEPEPAKTGKLLAPHERVGRVPRTRSLGGDKVLPCAQNVLWGIEMIRAPEAWALAPPAGGVQFGEGIVVGHPDTGYRPHEEIWDANPAQRRVRPGDGRDFEDGDPDPLDPLKKSDSLGHGTATASVIMSARAAAQERTVVGTAPSAQLVPLRVSDSVIHFSFKNVTQAIYHAVDRANAHVISMSLGGPFFSGALEAAIDHAISKGVIVLAAAGNVWPFVVYPARFDQVIAVAACNCNRQPWSKSASGSAVDITAPGESVWRALSTKRGGTVVYRSSRARALPMPLRTSPCLRHVARLPRQECAHQQVRCRKAGRRIPHAAHHRGLHSPAGVENRGLRRGYRRRRETARRGLAAVGEDDDAIAVSGARSR